MQILLNQHRYSIPVLSNNKKIINTKKETNTIEKEKINNYFQL